MIAKDENMSCPPLAHADDHVFPLKKLMILHAKHTYRRHQLNSAVWINQGRTSFPLQGSYHLPDQKSSVIFFNRKPFDHGDQQESHDTGSKTTVIQAEAAVP